jgi:pSer/pThr/pTyr-binding forkhead associated (FHA) protein
MELLVVAGADAGNQFTLEGNEVLIGRGQPESGQTDVIRLDDRSISRKQAWIRRDAAGTSITHIDTAANSTFVNGAEVSRARLSAGDRIEMGRVAIDVRARKGMNLSDLTQIMEGVARKSSISENPFPTSPTAPPSGGMHEEIPGEEVTLSTLDGLGEVTELRSVEIQLGELTVIRGATNLPDALFSIGQDGATLGRGEDVDVRIAESGVSRLHASIEIAGRSLVLVHRSDTNPTFVNGFPVLDRVALEDGDEIQLADRVALSLRLGTMAGASSQTDPPLASSALSQRMEHKIDLDREIEAFSVMGSFLDVDVVESRLMKTGGEKAEHIIVSFERFRGYVSGICETFDGQVLNSNGDELMCFFESARSALLAGSSILDRLDAFNQESNLLGKPFRFRLGVHTGMSLVDLNAGIAYSEVLDTAGHIQKQASPNAMLISQETLQRIREVIPVTPVQEDPAGGTGPLFQLDHHLTPADFDS